MKREDLTKACFFRQKKIPRKRVRSVHIAYLRNNTGRDALWNDRLTLHHLESRQTVKIVRTGSHGVKQVQHQRLPFLSSEEPDFVVAALEAVGLGADELLESTAVLLTQRLG